MTDTKPIASLSPSLLARKGGARPAMRSQMQPLLMSNATEHQLNEDLGFNDMGEDSPPPVPAAKHGADVVAILQGVKARRSATSEVRRQQDQLAARLGQTNGQAPVRRSALAEGRSAAFTLRLDAARHLKLRLACTLANQSAQQLVTDALDHLLASMPDVTDLAARAGKRR